MLMTDMYPSRLEQPSRLPRHEPVVYPGKAGPLSEGELENYARDGFLCLPARLSARRCAQLAAAIESEIAAPSTTLIHEADGKAVRSLFALHRASGPLADAVRDGQWTRLAEQILGSGVYIHQSRANRKPAFDGREFWWHSDFETWHVEDGLPAMRVLSIMIMLTDNTVTNGPLMVIPGSHRTFVGCVGRTPDNHHSTSLVQQQYGLPDRESIAALAGERPVQAICGAPGTVVIFDGNLLHGSSGNMSPLMRSNLFTVYNSVANRPVAPFGGQPPRPAHIADRGVDDAQ